MANARSKVAFQLSPGDAKTYAAMSHTGSSRLEAADFQALPAFQAYAQLLSGNQATPWCSVATLPLPPRSTARQGALARDRSRTRYGQPLASIEADLAGLVADASGVAPADSDAERLGRRRASSRPGGAQ